ncbi:GNAT family N-acetyltransferase [Paenibacillus sambharensis]|uniref:GNAT family N-acetyltransferase n=1 Tax=Paenibacillus sambharensis TaxID=1803190 RepID=A0A2W1LQY4_9BACL|nr:GNAT family N-acetyltransferase [Paenibacillus sambharensis]PZD97255.1 GNAT family N-acetyltransferase [Paenibacillus sambharensis]
MIIRSYSDKDMLACKELFINVFNQEPWNDNWLPGKAERYLSDYTSTPGFSGVVAEEGTEINGFIFGVRKQWWSGDEFFINEMCVSKNKQGIGLGSELLKYLESDLVRTGIKRITLLTDKGIPAEYFYKKNGFQEIDRLMFMCKSIE